jgi:hypothetical protein
MHEENKTPQEILRDYTMHQADVRRGAVFAYRIVGVVLVLLALGLVALMWRAS